MSHLHSVYDNDIRFKINPATRKISNESGKVILMQGDHNSERFTFEIPRYIEGHDVSKCNKVEVHYINTKSDRTEKHADVYPVEDLQISPTSEDVVICSWLISRNATRYDGSLSFVLRYSCLTEDVIDYQWSTDVYEGISVSKSISNTESIANKYCDILESWLKRLPECSRATIGTVKLLAENWVASENNENLYSQITTVYNVPKNFEFENCQVDLTPSVEQLVVFYEKDLTFVTENEDGVLTVYAIGQKPNNDYTIQVTITEVAR